MKRLGLMFAHFCFYFVVVSVIVHGDDCLEKVDQQQLLEGTLAGFGEFDNSNGKEGVRYRGQGFTNLLETITAVEFNLEQVGFTDLRVFIDTAKEDSTPEHDIDGAVFSFTIPNSELKEGMTKYYLPEELNMTHGKKYLVYLAPYKNGQYCDDYRNMFWSLDNPYDGGKGVVNINGEWGISDWGSLDLQFKTYGRECSSPIPSPTESAKPTPTPAPTQSEPTPTPTHSAEPTPTPILEELKILETTPNNGETGVDPNILKISAVFDAEIDDSGFSNPFSAELKELESGEKIAISYIAIGVKDISFFISSGMLPGKMYKATIFKDRVRGKNGEKMNNDYSWFFSTLTEPAPVPTQSETPTPTPTPTSQNDCGWVETFFLSQKSMNLREYGDLSFFSVTVGCGQGFLPAGIPIHIKTVRWNDRKTGKISVNGLSSKYKKQTVYTDDEGHAFFVVRGIRKGYLKIKVNVDDGFGYFKDTIKIKIRE